MSREAALAPRDLVGRRLGEFELLEKIGQGGFGEVYRAEQAGLWRPAVVKVLHARLGDDEAARIRFLREARLASVLDHPYAAHVYAFGAEPDGVLWIAMELVRGALLSEVMRGGAIPLDRFVPFFERLCEVVETAHERGIIHRDIKPQNVMVQPRAGALLPKLLDLGIAKDLVAQVAHRERQMTGTSGGSEEGVGAPRFSSGIDTINLGRKHLQRAAGEPDLAPASEELTGAGATMGSPAYMSPEQWMNADTADARADIYALGVLAYEAISGQLPFRGTVEELAWQHQMDAPPSLPDGLPPPLGELLARAMAKDPAERPSSALELARELRLASGLSAEIREIPRLAGAVSESAQKEYPQPIAEAVAELEATRTEHQSHRAIEKLVRVVLRLLSVAAFAASLGHSGAPRLDAAATELASALRRRRLSDEEWFELLRALLVPFATDARQHFMPELIGALLGSGPAGAALTSLLRRYSDNAIGSAETLSFDLEGALILIESLLQALSFLSLYRLSVITERGAAESWAGTRRRYRAVVALERGERFEPGSPVLVGPGNRVLALSPIAQVSPPSTHAEREVFLLEGRGRRGMLLSAFPEGFEVTSEAAAQWLNRLAAEAEDFEGSNVVVDAPYRGLAPFRAVDAGVFFGRDRDVEIFTNRLRTEPLLVSLGPSGAGKSSFVRAGVLPALGEAFRPLVFRPGFKPVTALKSKLKQSGISIDDLSKASDANEVTKRVHAVAHSRDETFVLVVDQFEEAFTLAGDLEERSVFFAWLACLASEPSDPVRVVATLREDFLARVQRESAFSSRLEGALSFLSTPGATELRRILVEPARRAGYTFESEDLVTEMVREVEGRAGALALLSFAAATLWTQRDASTYQLRSSAYRSMGGVTGALAVHAESVLAEMTSKMRGIARSVFVRLITREGTRAACAWTNYAAYLQTPTRQRSSNSSRRRGCW